jgi:hypothetical protein
LIQRGIMPSDKRIGGIKSNCQSQIGRQPPQAYGVAGLTLGSRIQFGSPEYRQYSCNPSDQFDGFTWCQRVTKENERRGAFTATYSVLHSRDGTIVYLTDFRNRHFSTRMKQMMIFNGTHNTLENPHA